LFRRYHFQTAFAVWGSQHQAWTIAICPAWAINRSAVDLWRNEGIGLTMCVCVYDMVTTYELRAYCCLLRIIHTWTCEICVFPSTTLRLLFVTTKCHRWFWSKYQNVPPMFRLNSGLLENDRAERRESSSRIALIYIVFGPQWGLHANVNNNVCSPIGRTSANNRILSISQIRCKFARVENINDVR